MVKKLISVLLCVAVLGTLFATWIYAEDRLPISIYVNEKEICTDTLPYIKNGTTFVPVRAISDALGAESVSWDAPGRKATVKGHSKMEFYIGKSYAYVNGEKKQMPQKAEIRNGRTMVPVRFFATAWGADIFWDDVLQAVRINRSGVSVPTECIANKYTPDDVLWLSRIVHAESAGEPIKGQVAVANVVLNRLKSNNYPNTIYGVIFDRNYGVQFQPVANGTIYNTPSKKSVNAAKRAVNGEAPVGECLYFLNESIATNKWIINNRKYYTTINNHSFYL